MKPCGGCMKVRRAIINRAPARIAAPLARVFLPTITTAEAVVQETRTWVGVPFLHHGRGRKGVDCWGVPSVVLSALGALQDGFSDTDYPRHPLQDQCEARIRQFCTPLPNATPGCLVALRLARTVTHVAIYTDTDTLIHATERQGLVIEHGFRGMWRTRFAPTFWALPGVRYG